MRFGKTIVPALRLGWLMLQRVGHCCSWDVNRYAADALGRASIECILPVLHGLIVLLGTIGGRVRCSMCNYLELHV